MLTIPTSLRVFAHRFATDMRKSFSGLVGIIESELGQQVESGHLFLFFNRRRDRVKILFFTGDGVEGGSKRRRGGIVAAVENGGAHWCISGSREDNGVSRYLAQLRREAQECDPTWSFGKKFVGAC